MIGGVPPLLATIRKPPDVSRGMVAGVVVSVAPGETPAGAAW
jgi:hypothetical protein